MSGAPIIIGTNQLPKPPTITGITKKKIIMNACAVTITLNSWWLPRRKPLDGEDNSKRISTLSTVPQTPERAPNRKYRVPISLWFVEKNQRRTKATTLFSEGAAGAAVEVKIGDSEKDVSLFSNSITADAFDEEAKAGTSRHDVASVQDKNLRDSVVSLWGEALVKKLADSASWLQSA